MQNNFKIEQFDWPRDGGKMGGFFLPQLDNSQLPLLQCLGIKMCP